MGGREGRWRERVYVNYSHEINYCITICLTNPFVNLFLRTSNLGRFNTEHKWISAVQGMSCIEAVGILFIAP